MSLCKFDMFKKAIEDNRKISFVFKKDGSLREVEVYDFYVDDKGNEKLWVYQTYNRSGVRVFFTDDVTYPKLEESFNPRVMAEAPRKSYSV